MSEDDSTNVSRRSVLGGIAGLAVAGSGLAAVSSTASANSSVSITSADASATLDRGELTSLTINPTFTVNWTGLDDAVGKVFWLVEASVDGGDFYPLFRATPWLTADQIGTTGSYAVEPSFEEALNADDRFDDGSGPDYSAGPLVVADEQGRPDYANYDFGSISGNITYESFMNGTSIGGADDYPGAHEDGGWQNNYWDVDAGYYGAASDTTPFNETTDGETKTTDVTLRYTFEFQRPNLSQLKYRVDFANYDGPEAGATQFTELSVAEQKRFAAEQIDGLEESDIDDGNSKLVMNGEDGFPEFGTPSGLSYSQIRDNADAHPGLLSATTTFTVSVTNKASSSDSTGTSGAEAE
ncbi:hypothetical protein [Halosegnis marinus]|uniref:Tat (Twin-arginine translocation) pathway signal sequence n=1 Tax=Halosegnis marinus TaxID=3034023 RepID=A0ABD5ZPP6_9EURY|nr:hypothetical protein [Halosegnis sp. DT85]